MFHRKRATSNPPVNTNASSAATTAATQAFLAHRASNASLSSAAAAAALRSHATSPVPVSNVQTKRIIRKQASNSSLGSVGGSVRGGGGRALQRQNSSGSMTERTFREPSPNRGSPNTYPDNAPPVPALPKNMIPPVPQKSSKRASSLEPPLRVSSPPPKKPHGRGVSLDRRPGSPLLTNPKQRTPKLHSVQELQRTDSSGSINFSYPTGARAMSPSSPSEDRVASPQSTNRRPGSPLGTTPHLKSTLSAGEVSHIQNLVQGTADRPVKKKKKVVAKGAAEGSHLAGNSTGGRLVGTAVNGDAPPETHARSSSQQGYTSETISEQASAPPKPKMKKRVKAVPPTDSNQPVPSYGSDVDSGAESAESLPDRPKGFSTRAAGMLAKQPSVVREDRELEEAAEQGGRTILPQPATGQVKKTATANSSNKYSESKQHSRTTSEPTPNLTPDTSQSTGTKSGGRLGSGPGKSSLRGERHQSLSPSRSTRFSTRPAVFDALNSTRHEPPPRSLSPAKSAMKHSPSPRQRSPIDDPASLRPGYGQTPSEASDNTSLLSEEGARSIKKKKKQHRVSFDEEAVVLGTAVSPPTSPDTPVVMSPQNQDTTKRNWFSRGKKDRKEQDESMKPTPALPSFGSVRRDEGATQRFQGRTSDSIPEPTSSSARAIVERINMSDDSAVGGILAQDFASNNANESALVKPTLDTQNTKESGPSSSKVRLAEGTGYGSESEGSVYSTDTSRARMANQGKPISPEERAEGYRALASPPLDVDDDGHQLGSIQQGDNVPSFNLIQATPNLQDTEDQQQWPGLQGSANHIAEEGEQDVAESPIIEHHPTDPTPASLGIAEPEPEEAAANHTPGSAAVGHMAEGLRIQTSPHLDEEDDSDDTGNSIYSDAAEDLSDLEGDGFGSINAIVESPAIKPALMPPDIPTGNAAKETRPKNKLERQDSDIPEPGAEEGWDKAQEYWSNLSERRKKQMELEAMSVDEEADEPTQPKQKKKVMVKKKTTAPSASGDPPLPPWPDQQYLRSNARPKGSGAPTLKSSMRAETTSRAPTNDEGLQKSKWAEPKSLAAEPPVMKKSMRDGTTRTARGGGQQARQSVDVAALQPAPRPREPKGALQKKTRPVSAAPVLDYSSIPSPIKHSRDFSGSSAASSTTLPPRNVVKTTPTPLKKTLSNGSDSSSSFRKQRRPASSGGFTMRSTMRGAPDPMPSRDARPTSPENIGNRSSKFSIRSLSPTGSTTRKPFGPPAGGMRSSMRGSSDAAAPSMRKEPKKRTKSPSRFSLGGKQPKTKAASAKPRSGLFQSRFADSSDEDDFPTTFRSRYDSSDDDEPVSPAPLNLAPVRGIPRRIGEADKESTDLSDSEDEPTSPVPKKSSKAAAVLGNRSTQPALPAPVTHASSPLATGSLRHDDTNLAAKPAKKKDKKRSFFGGRSKKKEEAVSTNPLQLDTSSPLLGQTPNSPAVGSPATRAKLQRRNTPKSLALAKNDNWPLPPPTPGINGNRPSTADGTAIPSPNFRASLRPDIGARRSTTPAPPVDGQGVGKAATVPSADVGKKKRFGGLRKVFGMKG